MNARRAALNREEVENNISCVHLSVANVLCWPLFIVTGKRQTYFEKNHNTRKGLEKSFYSESLYIS